MVTRLHPWCPLSPHPNPPPRRGEGRVGVMFLMSFLQCLGLFSYAMNMLIGVDTTCWQNNRGYGRQGRGLLRALVPTRQGEPICFLHGLERESETVPPEAEVRMVAASAPTVIAASANGYRSPRDMMADGPGHVRPRVLTCCSFPTVYSYVPVFSRAKKVVIIHDVIAENYAHLTLPSYRARLFWKAKVAPRTMAGRRHRHGFGFFPSSHLKAIQN